MNEYGEKFQQFLAFFNCDCSKHLHFHLLIEQGAELYFVANKLFEVYMVCDRLSSHILNVKL